MWTIKTGSKTINYLLLIDILRVFSGKVIGRNCCCSDGAMEGGLRRVVVRLDRSRVALRSPVVSEPFLSVGRILSELYLGCLVTLRDKPFTRAASRCEILPRPRVNLTKISKVLMDDDAVKCFRVTRVATQEKRTS